MTDEEYEIRKSKLNQEIANLSDKINNFDGANASAQELCEHFNTLDRLKEECDDMINELEVDDFLEHGAGYHEK